MLATALSAALLGLEAEPIRVEVDVRMGIPHFELVGLAEATVRESRVRVRSALAQVGVVLAEYSVVVNLAPADLRKTGSGFDLAIAVGVLAAVGKIPLESLEGTLFLGELSLSGRVQGLRGLLPRLLSAQRRGLERAVVPKANEAEAALVRSMDVRVAAQLDEVVHALGSCEPLPGARRSKSRIPRPEQLEDLEDVKGQPVARRALEVAAAGRHNVLFIGPPGAGKTMLARRLPTLLPPLSEDEALETLAVASVAGDLLRSSFDPGRLANRPFRAPHHTVSEVALVGGGDPARPGEVSLAHRGVLFLDELPEFRRGALESLRQPLEDGTVTVSRANSKATYPAVPLVVAAMNPCPCGYHGEERCHCTKPAVSAYKARLSGPLVDRLDLHVSLPPVDVQSLRVASKGESSAVVRARVEAAAAIQEARRAAGLTRALSNASLGPADLERICRLDQAGADLLVKSAKSLGLSARAYGKVLRVARTIADLAGVAEIRCTHVAEAIGYRQLDRAPPPLVLAA